MFKATVMVQNLTECLSVQYFLYHWYLCNQIRHDDVLITRPNANNLGYSILTVSWIRVTGGRGEMFTFAVQNLDKPCCFKLSFCLFINKLYQAYWAPWQEKNPLVQVACDASHQLSVLLDYGMDLPLVKMTLKKTCTHACCAQQGPLIQ